METRNADWKNRTSNYLEKRLGQSGLSYFFACELRDFTCKNIEPNANKMSRSHGRQIRLSALRKTEGTQIQGTLYFDNGGPMVTFSVPVNGRTYQFKAMLPK